MGRLLRLLRSVRLAVVLIVLVVVLSVVATLIPQGRPAEFYRESMPGALGSIVLAVGFDRFTRSPLYLAPVALFVVSLGVCTVHRVLSRARARAPRRYGPDLIHLSLLVLAAGGVASALLRQERSFTLAVGDTAQISGGIAITLEDFAFLRYDDGAPRDWVSTVRVSRDGRLLHEAFAVEVNRPLRVGLLAVYQTTYDTDAVLHLTEPGGGVHALSIGQGVRDGESVWYFTGAERLPDGSHAALFEQWRSGARVSVARAAAGATVAGYGVASVAATEFTGLTAVRDPGAIPALAALGIGTLGLALTFIQRRREEST